MKPKNSQNTGLYVHLDDDMCQALAAISGHVGHNPDNKKTERQREKLDELWRLIARETGYAWHQFGKTKGSIKLDT